jgi:hypothetical protein
MQRLKRKIQQIVIWFLVASPIVSLAQFSGGIIPPNPGLPGPAKNATNLQTWIIAIIQVYMLPLAGLLAVFFIIIGGYQYMFSGANEELATKGKHTLTNALIGLIIIILSYVMVTIVGRTLGAT